MTNPLNHLLFRPASGKYISVKPAIESRALCDYTTEFRITRSMDWATYTATCRREKAIEMTNMLHKGKWSDLTAGQKAPLVLRGSVQFALLVVALAEYTAVQRRRSTAASGCAAPPRSSTSWASIRLPTSSSVGSSETVLRAIVEVWPPGRIRRSTHETPERKTKAT